jgi:subtilisin family serine protease
MKHARLLQLVLLCSLTVTIVVSCKQEKITPQNKSTPDVNSQNSVANGLNNKIRATGDYVIIAVSEKSLPSNLKTEVARLGGTIKNKLDGIGVAFVHSKDPNFISKASAIKGIKSVIHDISTNWLPGDRDKSKTAASAFAPSDFFYPLQWDMMAIHANDAWGKGYKGQGATVAILDGGFYLNHHDIAPNIDLGRSTSVVAGLPLQFQNTGEFSHGTHVAGIAAAAQNNYGTVGVASKAKLMLVRVLTDEGTGSWGDIITGIYYAAAHGANVINMSLGEYIPHHLQIIIDGKHVNFTKEFQELLIAMNRSTSYANKKGAVVVASAGNAHIDLGHIADYDHYPSGCVHVLCVSATSPKGWTPGTSTNLDIPTTYTNYGTSAIDFAAPGGDFYPDIQNLYDLVISPGSVDPDGTEYWWWAAGTSMASPHVAGVAALIVAKHPGYSPAQVEAALRKSSDDLGKPGRDDFFGLGRVNASKAGDQ